MNSLQASESISPDNQRSKKRGWRIRGRWLVGIVLVSMIGGIACWEATAYFARPMFHDRFGFGDHGLYPVWWPNYGITDLHGNIAYFDRRLNIGVLVITRDPVNEVSPLGISATWRRAWLAEGSQFEFLMHRTRNVLAVRGKREVRYFEISQDAATQWYDQLWDIFKRPEQNLVDEILTRHNGPDKEELEKFALECRGEE